MKLEEFLDWLYDTKIEFEYLGERSLKVCMMNKDYGECPCGMTKQEVIDLWNQAHQEEKK